MPRGSAAWEAWEAAWIASTVGPLDGAIVLDIGAGEGRWMGSLMAQGAWAYGVDSHPRSPRVEPADFPDMSQAPLLPTRWDGITCRETLYYLPLDKALQAIHALLLPGGWFHIKSRHGTPSGPITHQPSPDVYADMLERHGFRLVAERRMPRGWGRYPARFLTLALRI